VWDATRDGEIRARDYARLVLDNVATEDESTALRYALAQLTVAATTYSAPDHRDELLATVASELWALTAQAAPGSDNQFQFLRTFAQVAAEPAQLDHVQALLDGTETLEGIEIDADLRWELLTALVAGGRAGTAEIDAALAADRTATGAQSAAQARAALPTAEGKQAAWASVWEADTEPNTIVRTTGLGFRRAADVELLRPYVGAYFDALQGVWESRSYAIAAALIGGFYPSPLADAELRDATVAWLDANPEPPALRRLVSELLSGVERALRAQAKDAE
jgi:aminopeptidase N